MSNSPQGAGYGSAQQYSPPGYNHGVGVHQPDRDPLADEIGKGVENLREVVEALRVRVKPVLRPEPYDGDRPTANDARPVAPLRKTSDVLAETIRLLRLTIEQIDL